MKILVVEDNRILAKNIREYLTLKSFQAEVAFDGVMGMEQMKNHHFDVIILDINLPGKDGLTLCRELRESGDNTPVLFLTSSNTPKDVVIGLNTGADDYLGKPFDFEELIARILSLGRRNASNKTTTIQIGDIEIDTTKRTVIKKILKENWESPRKWWNLHENRSHSSPGEGSAKWDVLKEYGEWTSEIWVESSHFIEIPIELSTKEFDLLHYLAQNRGTPIDRQVLLEHVWGEFDAYMFSRTVDVHISTLRKKLGDGIIETRKGFGYLVN